MADPPVSRGLAETAARVQAEAAALPDPDAIRSLAERAVSHGGAGLMTNEEVRQLAAKAVEQADQLAGLLRELSQMLPPAAQHDQEVPGGH